MRKFIFCLNSFVLALCLIILSGCKKDTTSNFLDASTKNYYLSSGYISINISSSLSISSTENDAILNFNDNSTLVKEKTPITISPSSGNYNYSNLGYYANFDNGQIMSSIKINGREYSYYEKDFKNCQFLNNVNIDTSLHHFEIIGVSYLVLNPQTNPELSSDEINISKFFNFVETLSLNENYADKNKLLYTYLKDNNFNNFSESNFECNISFKVKSSNENEKINLSFYFIECSEDQTIPFVVLRDENNHLYLYEMNYNETKNCYSIKNSETSLLKINSVNLYFIDDFTFQNEY